MSDIKSIKRITPKTINDNVTPTAPKEQEHMYTVWGVANATRSGDNGFGEWTALVGDFGAIRIKDGQRFRASQTFLPEPFNSAVADKIRASDGPLSIEFSFDIHIIPDDTSPKGYTYVGEAIKEPEHYDLINALEQKALAHIKALPAPKPARSKKNTEVV